MSASEAPIQCLFCLDWRLIALSIQLWSRLYIPTLRKVTSYRTEGLKYAFDGNRRMEHRPERCQ